MDACRRKREGGKVSDASPEDYVEMGGKYIQLEEKQNAVYIRFMKMQSIKY